MPAARVANRFALVADVSSPGRGSRVMADWVELRVHGVSGTPPEAMLKAQFADPALK